MAPGMNGHTNGGLNGHGIDTRVQDPLERPQAALDADAWTTNAGHPVASNMNSETVGQRGPVLLEDYHLTEKLAQFDRERIPERVVHARGMAAKGVFEVTHDVSDLTHAKFLQPGKKTDLIARFSTVIHERGSPETMRDVRGFSVKMYTEEGNWDFVGNDIPVFFIRDAISFPDMVHALKPDPLKHLQQGSRILDFMASHPESCHILTFLLGDEGIPANYRQMNGFGVHTFSMINAQGKETYVKYHWITRQGEKYLKQEEAEALGEGPRKVVTATTDLYEAIEDGNFPAWDLYVQTMDPATEMDYDWGDPLDSTKTWPEDQFPLRPVGRMTLNKNVDNWFNDNEQVAFNPGIMPPGLAPSNDKLLQGRIFSYSDTQRYRLGANYLLLPVNAPRCPHVRNHWDGTMQTTQRDQDVDYFPSHRKPYHDNGTNGKSTPVYAPREEAGVRQKKMISKQNNFAQAGDRIRAFTPDQLERFNEQVMMWMSEKKTLPVVRAKWLEYWSRCDAKYGARLRDECAKKGLEVAKGVEVPEVAHSVDGTPA